MLEIDFELVALDRGNGAVAEFAVEYALAERQVGAARVAEADRGRPSFDPPLRLRLEAAPAAGALPPRATSAGAHRLGGAKMGERVGPLRPLRSPQALTA